MRSKDNKPFAYLLESVVRHCDSDFPPVAAHLIDGLDLVASLVLMALEEDLDIIFESLWKKRKTFISIEQNVSMTEIYS